MAWPSNTAFDHLPIKAQRKLMLRVTEFEDGPTAHYCEADPDMTMNEVLVCMSEYLRACANDWTYDNPTRTARQELHQLIGCLADLACYSKLKDECLGAEV